MDFLFQQIEKKISLLKNHRLLFFVVPILFGFWSYLLGQDRNADLINYHLYNAFSFLNNKHEIDRYVAGLQGFFNPLIDIPYFVLIQNLPPRIVAFIMGAMNGLIYIAIFFIADSCFNLSKSQDRYKKISFIAIVACLTPNFLAGLGNSMGDNFTALFGLLSLALILKNYENIAQNKKIYVLIISGIVIGAASGLKLTNAAFALALCLAIMFQTSIEITHRLKLSFIFGSAVLFGLLITGGFWFYNLWQEYGNPFFPSLSHIFKNQYFTQDPFSNGLITKTFGPKNFSELLGWPFISMLNYSRAGRGLIHQIMWSILYLLAIYTVINKFIIKENNIKKFITPQAQFVSLFVFIAYLIHICIFKIQRYSVTIEVLTPLVLLILLNLLLTKEASWRMGKRIIFISIAITLLGGFGTWGHTKFNDKPFMAEIPKLGSPEKSTVIIVDAYSPASWLVTLFPKNLAFFRLDIMPNTDSELKKIIESRKGSVYALFFGYYNWRIDNIVTWQRVISKLGLLNSEEKCSGMDKFIKKIKFRGKILQAKNNQDFCYLTLKDEENLNPNIENSKIIISKKLLLKKKGFNLDERTCEVKKAKLGEKNWRYIWCEIAN
jgi:hypothetical protein